MLRRVTRTWTMPRVTRCAWNGLRWCSQNSRRRSRRPAEPHSHRAHSARQLPTPFGCGTSSRRSEERRVGKECRYWRDWSSDVCSSDLAELKAQIEAASRTALPSSPLGKAAAYTLRLWDKLTRFLDYPELELSNNLAENSMRPVAIGRRNWTHIGHEKAGPRVAAILSIVETCRRLKIPVREYLTAVLPGLANSSIQRLPELTPTAWAASNL